MNRTVWKYALALIDEPQTIAIPRHAVLMHVGLQDGLPCVWLLVDPESERREVRFVVRGTGHPVEVGLNPIGTAIDPQRGFVWHVFLQGAYLDLGGALI